MTNQYETVFILTPVLSADQMKETVEKFKTLLTSNGAEILNEDNWGLKISLPHWEEINRILHSAWIQSRPFIDAQTRNRVSSRRARDPFHHC